MNPPPGDSLPGEPGGAGGRGRAPHEGSRLPAVRVPAAPPDRRAAPSTRRLPAVPVPRLPEVGPTSADATEEVARTRTGEIVAGRFLIEVGAPTGSEARPCPADRLPQPERLARASGPRPGTDSATPATPVVLGTGPGGTALLERRAEVERVRDLLARGRSVRVTGAEGSGRSALLTAVADSCAGLAPDGVVRLTGYRRTPADLLQDLFSATHRAPDYRPDQDRLPQLLAKVGAIVVVDDVEFGGASLDELLDSAPDCAFLVSTGLDVPSPSDAARLEESRLEGLSRDACLELLTALAGRPLDDVERAWAVDLWFESEGLPLRFVQAGALLRHRDVAADALAVAREERANLFGGPAGYDPDLETDPQLHEESLRRAVPLPSVAESAAPALHISKGLSEPARAVLRLAVALGGQCPTAPHLPALVDVGHGESALHELVDCGLAVSTGEHHRLTTGVQPVLAGQWPDGESAHGAAQHFAWWVGHSSVSPEQVAAEAEVLIAALQADREAGRHSSVVLLARAAAPAFALALRWGAWEQTLRLGLEAARAAGAVSDETWFHQELGVLALVTGAEQRARAEFEAAIALRGALGDSAGGASARRMLLLLAGAGSGTAALTAGAKGQGRAMGQIPWRRRSSLSPDRRASRRRTALVAGVGVALLAGLGTVVGLATADEGPVVPVPVGSTPDISVDVNVPSDDGGESRSAAPGASASSASPSASSSATGGASRSATTTAGPTTGATGGPSATATATRTRSGGGAVRPTPPPGHSQTPTGGSWPSATTTESATPTGTSSSPSTSAPPTTTADPSTSPGASDVSSSPQNSLSLSSSMPRSSS